MRVSFCFWSMEDVVNLIVYVGDCFCSWIDSFLRPCCDVFSRVLKADVCNDFIIHLT